MVLTYYLKKLIYTILRYNLNIRWRRLVLLVSIEDEDILTYETRNSLHEKIIKIIINFNIITTIYFSQTQQLFCT